MSLTHIWAMSQRHTPATLLSQNKVYSRSQEFQETSRGMIYHVPKTQPGCPRLTSTWSCILWASRDSSHSEQGFCMQTGSSVRKQLALLCSDDVQIVDLWELSCHLYVSYTNYLVWLHRNAKVQDFWHVTEFPCCQLCSLFILWLLALTSLTVASTLPHWSRAASTDQDFTLGTYFSPIAQVWCVGT